MMKIFIITFSCLLTILGYGQDYEMLTYINEYRLKNKLSELKYNNNLGNVAIEQNRVNVLKDSVFHSHKYSEIALMGNSLPATEKEKQDFIMFLKTFFDYEYIEPYSKSDVCRMVKLYSIYLFHNSQSHKRILLGNYTNIGLDISLKNINLKKNVVNIGDKTYTLKNTITHHKVDFFVVVNFF